MNVSNRQRLLGIVAIAALSVFVGDRMILSPLIKGWSARSARIADLRKRISQGVVLVEREAAIRDRWAAMKTNALSREISIAEGQVLKAFDRWSQESGVSISSIRPQWKRGSDDAMTLECRADAFGELTHLTRFLYLVEKDSLGVKVDSIEFSARDKEARQLNLILQVSGLMLQPPGS